mmetsp:Transcript_20402/g.49366  ORF Transcript_20402/g.49366 Transcript_20402/m.49366 type:complete len:409 (-) Transcript_20402:906-2132(-)
MTFSSDFSSLKSTHAVPFGVFIAFSTPITISSTAASASDSRKSSSRSLVMESWRWLMYAALLRIWSAASHEGACPATLPKPPTRASNSAGVKGPRRAPEMSRQSWNERSDFLCLRAYSVCTAPQSSIWDACPMPSMATVLTLRGGRSTLRSRIAPASFLAPAEKSCSFQTASFCPSSSSVAIVLQKGTASMSARSPPVPTMFDEIERNSSTHSSVWRASASFLAPSFRIRFSRSCSRTNALPGAAAASASAVVPESPISLKPRSRSRIIQPAVLMKSAMYTAPASFNCALCSESVWRRARAAGSFRRDAMIGGGCAAPRGSLPKPGGFPIGLLLRVTSLSVHPSAWRRLASASRTSAAGLESERSSASGSHAPSASDSSKSSAITSITSSFSTLFRPYLTDATRLPAL